MKYCILVSKNISPDCQLHFDGDAYPEINPDTLEFVNGESRQRLLIISNNDWFAYWPEGNIGIGQGVNSIRNQDTRRVVRNIATFDSTIYLTTKEVTE
jgi:hypothetical protein